MTRPAAWAVLLLVAAVGAGACTAKAKRRYFDNCTAAADCESNLCTQNVCSKPCVSSADCGTGICVAKQCLPVNRIDCAAAADCEKFISANACRAVACETGHCSLTLAVDASPCGASCAAGSPPFWVRGACHFGTCNIDTKQAAIPCTDGNSCTSDSCSPQSGCSFASVSGTCEDGDPCTTGDNCASGACKGGPLKNCDDGDACTTGDACVGGNCAVGVATNCNDGNACTADNCVQATGCVHAKLTGPCVDNSVCTSNEVCVDGVCTSDKLDCDDKNPCTADTCDVATGCSYSDNTEACDDGNNCTKGDFCDSGKCNSGAVNCDDGNPCTNDACGKDFSCAHANNSNPCDDGDACTKSDACNLGQCLGLAGLWQRKLNYGETVYPKGAAVSNAEAMVVGFSAPTADYAKRRIAVFDHNGLPKWQAAVNVAGLDQPEGATATASGKFLVVGHSSADANAASQAYLRSYGAAGVVDWEKTIAKPKNGASLRAVAMSGKTICAVGMDATTGAGGVLVARYLEDGTELGVATQTSNGGGTANGIVAVGEGEGFAMAAVDKAGNAKVVRLSSTADIAWVTPVLPVGATHCSLYAIGNLGSHLVAVGSADFGLIVRLVAVRLDASGAVMWTYVYQPPQAFLANSIGAGVAGAGSAIAISVTAQLDASGYAGILLLDGYGNLLNEAFSVAPETSVAAGLAAFANGTFLTAGAPSPQIPGPLVATRSSPYFAFNCQDKCANIAGGLCDDGLPCTADSCDPAAGCVSKVLADGALCGTNLKCTAGKCGP